MNDPSTNADPLGVIDQLLDMNKDLTRRLAIALQIIEQQRSTLVSLAETNVRLRSWPAPEGSTMVAP